MNIYLIVTLLGVNRLLFNGVIGFVVQIDVRQMVHVPISNPSDSMGLIGTVKLIHKELINILFNLPIPLTGGVGRMYMLM